MKAHNRPSPPPLVVAQAVQDENAASTVVNNLIDGFAEKNRSAEVGSGIDLCAFLVGVPLVVGFYILMIPFHETYAGELLSGRIPPLIMYLSFVAVVALCLKYVGYHIQSRAFKCELLPTELGSRINVRNANQFREYLKRVGLSRRSILVARLKNGLEYLSAGHSTSEVTEYLDTQSQVDAQKIAAGYGYVGLIVWALPILGFIGTVLGIGAAVSEFSGAVNAAEDMSIVKDSLTGVTSGLGVSFNTTLLALVMSMLVMFPKKFVQKREEALLTTIDTFVQNQFCRRLQADSVPAPGGDTENSFRVELTKLENTLSKGLEGLGERFSDHVSKAIEQATNATNAASQKLVAEIRNAFSLPNDSYEVFCERVLDLEERRTSALRALSEQNSETLAAIGRRYDAILPAFKQNSVAMGELICAQQQTVDELEPRLAQVSKLVESFSISVEQSSKRNELISSVDLSERSQQILEHIYRSSRRNEELQKISNEELRRLNNSGLIQRSKAAFGRLLGKVDSAVARNLHSKGQVEAINVQNQQN